MSELENKRFVQAMIALTLILTGTLVHGAAKNVGGYWSNFDSIDGANEDMALGYVVVDAAAAQNAHLGKDAMGPFNKASAGPSFEDSDVVMEEESTEKEKTSKTEVAVRWKEVTLQAGDTLSKLAEKYNCSVSGIMKANELKDQHRVKEGQILYVPDAEEYVTDTLAHVRNLKKEEEARMRQADPLKITYYVVKNGDTLWSVANTFDLDVNSLFGCNKITETDILKVGSTLRVPNQDGIFVTVRANQTVASLAKEYGIYPETILKANEMKAGAALVRKQELFLPGAKVTAFVESGKGRTAVSGAVKQKLTAKRGFGWPTVGKISSPFGWRRDPVGGRRDFHTGIDIRAPRGRPIVAAAAGRVVHAGWMGGYGKTIVISHPGNMTTLYAHCSKLLVQAGTQIRRGQRVALIGSTGRSTGNHVHFEVRRGGSPINPIKALR